MVHIILARLTDPVITNVRFPNYPEYSKFNLSLSVNFCIHTFPCNTTLLCGLRSLTTDLQTIPIFSPLTIPYNDPSIQTWSTLPDHRTFPLKLKPVPFRDL